MTEPFLRTQRKRDMIKKSHSLFVCTLLLSTPAQAVVPQQGELVFDIYRNGKPFGTHTLVFDENGTGTEVQIDINMQYKLGPITLFRYDHSNIEIWDGDRIVSMKSETDDDGKQYDIDAEWGEQLSVDANGETFTAAPMYTTSYWNPIALEGDKLLNTQKGEVEDITVDYKGVEKFDVLGTTVQAKHYSVDASVPIEIWYDEETNQWVGLKFNIRGSDFEYRRMTPIQ